MKYKAWILLIFANLFWAGNIVFGKLSAAEFPPEWTAFLRWLVALALLVPIAQVFEKPDWLRIWKGHWRIIVLLGALSIVIFSYLSYASLKFTSATNGALINTLTPVLLVLFSLIFLKEKAGLVQFLGLVLSFAGVLTVLTGGNPLQLFHIRYNKGDAMMFMAVVCWAVYSLLIRKAKAIPPVTLVALTALSGSVLMVPFLFIEPLQVGQITSFGILGIVYMGVFPAVGSFIFWNQGVKALGAGKAGITMNLMPVFTALISVMMGESLTLAQLIGGMITIGGMALTSVKRKQVSLKYSLAGDERHGKSQF